MDNLLKDCEQEIYEHEMELIQASKDPETKKREQEEYEEYVRRTQKRLEELKKRKK